MCLHRLQAVPRLLTSESLVQNQRKPARLQDQPLPLVMMPASKQVVTHLQLRTADQRSLRIVPAA